MTDVATSLGAIAVAGSRCEKCGAAPTHPCRVTRGRTQGDPISAPHAARMRPVEAAWRVGFTEGMIVQGATTRRRLEGVTHVNDTIIEAACMRAL